MKTRLLCTPKKPCLRRKEALFENHRNLHRFLTYENKKTRETVHGFKYYNYLCPTGWQVAATQAARHLPKP